MSNLHALGRVWEADAGAHGDALDGPDGSTPVPSLSSVVPAGTPSLGSCSGSAKSSSWFPLTVKK